MSRAVWFGIGAIAVGVFAPYVSHAASTDDAVLAPLIGADLPDAVAGSYIVVFQDGMPDATLARAARVVQRAGGKIQFTYHSALHGLAGQLPSAVLQEIRENPAVKYVESIREVAGQAVSETKSAQPQRSSMSQSGEEAAHHVDPAFDQPNPPNWGLDRIDQRVLPLDNNYSYEYDGRGVAAYIIDTGVNHVSEFDTRLAAGFNATGDGGDSTDCPQFGHGTLMAGVIGGSVHGVAKKVTLVSVRAQPCPEGAVTSAILIHAVDLITADQTQSKKVVYDQYVLQPVDSAYDDAVRNSMAAGVSYVAPAGGNTSGQGEGDACDRSPSDIFGVFVIGASDKNDQIPDWDDQGHCQTMFAPGVDIETITNGGVPTLFSSTSIAAAGFTGLVATFMQSRPPIDPFGARYTLLAAAVPDVFSVDSGSGTGFNRIDTANLLANGTMTDLSKLYDATFPPNKPTKVFYYPSKQGVQTPSRHLFVGSLRPVGPVDGTDFDLRLERKVAGTWVPASVSYSTSVWEDIHLLAPAGTYRWAVANFNNLGGEFDFRSNSYKGDDG